MKSSSSSPKPGMTAVQPHPWVWMSMTSTSRTSPGSALDSDGAGQRVQAVPVEGGEGIGGGVGRDLAVADLAGVVDDRVAWRDGESGIQLVVPDIVDLVLRIVVRLRHSCEPPLFSCLSRSVLSQLAAKFSTSTLPLRRLSAGFGPLEGPRFSASQCRESSEAAMATPEGGVLKAKAKPGGVADKRLKGVLRATPEGGAC